MTNDFFIYLNGWKLTQEKMHKLIFIKISPAMKKGSGTVC